MGNRYKHGYPFCNSPARAMDVVARLSGVNFSSVEKVFAAMMALEKGLGWDPAQVINLNNAPSVPAHKDSERRVLRVSATQREVERVLRRLDKLPAPVLDALVLTHRFYPDGSSRTRVSTDPDER
jgi:hypothetical protein